jgi:hypothetical protein
LIAAAYGVTNWKRFLIIYAYCYGMLRNCSKDYRETFSVFYQHAVAVTALGGTQRLVAHWE